MLFTKRGKENKNSWLKYTQKEFVNVNSVNLTKTSPVWSCHLTFLGCRWSCVVAVSVS